MLSKQSIRGQVKVYANGIRVDKEKVLEYSQTWSERQENFFRKMLKQGGTFSLKGVNFHIDSGDKILNSKGEKDEGVKQIGDIEF